MHVDAIERRIPSNSIATHSKRCIDKGMVVCALAVPKVSFIDLYKSKSTTCSVSGLVDNHGNVFDV
jgi:hypothetical protein